MKVSVTEVAVIPQMSLTYKDGRLESVGIGGELYRSDTSLAVENAKLRDAMYSDAERHALQHMDEDELRIWATKQADFIEELRECLRDIADHIGDGDGSGVDRGWIIGRMCELGIEVG